MALPVTKDFTGSDGTALTTYDSNFANNSGALVINTNGVCPNSSGNEIGVRWGGDSFNADQYSQIVLVARTGDDNRFIGPGVRHAAAGTATYYFYYVSVNQRWKGKLVAGAFTQIGSTGGATATNDVLRIEAEGTTLRTYRNGALDTGVGGGGSHTDSSIASGAAGIAGYGTGTTLRADDWEAGNLGAAATTSLPLLRAGLRQQHLLVR